MFPCFPSPCHLEQEKGFKKGERDREGEEVRGSSAFQDPGGNGQLSLATSNEEACVEDRGTNGPGRHGHDREIKAGR